MKYPPIAYSFNAARHPRPIPFNRECVRALQKAVALTGVRYYGKVLADASLGHAFWDYRHIHLPDSDPRSLLHEYVHYLQQARGFRVVSDAIRFRDWLQPRYFPAFERYYAMPSEREANRRAKTLWHAVKSGKPNLCRQNTKTANRSRNLA